MSHDPLCGIPAAQYRDCACDLIARVRADERATTRFDQWLDTGTARGWITEPICSTHDRIPYSDAEEAEWDEGDDPCAPVLRIWPDAVAAP